MTKRKKTGPGKRNRPKPGDKTKIRFKPSVKKKFSNWLPFLKIALLLIVLYYAAKGITGCIAGREWFRGKEPVNAEVQIKDSPEQGVTVIRVVRPPRPQRRLSPDKPKIVIVIDDIGHTRRHEEWLVSLGNQVTYAVLPLLTYSRYFSQLSFQTGAEVILHQPLEARDGTIPGPGLITSRMTLPHVQEVLSRNLQSVPQHWGVNNHMGSEGTSDPHLMQALLAELGERNLFFLDSQTTGESVAAPIAREMGVPYLRRDLFLDNVDDPGAIRFQMQKLRQIARRQGYAIGIGHYHANTLQVLNEEIPKLKKENFELISLSDLIDFKDLRTPH